jgi:hypothetical protein
MKKVLIITISLLILTLSSYAQERDVVIIKPTNGNNAGNGNSSSKLVCAIFEQFFEFGCANVVGKCQNASGTVTVIIQTKVCVEDLRIDNSGNGNTSNPHNGSAEKMKLFDLDFGFVATGESINIVEMNQLKNKSIVIPNDLIIDNEEMHAIIKEGVYKVKNSKMHTLISIGAE